LIGCWWRNWLRPMNCLYPNRSGPPPEPLLASTGTSRRF
jgi:hypothetical protein